jgi:hypothetical protein
MKRHTKAIVQLVFLFAVVGSLSACSGDPATTSADSSAANPAAQPAPRVLIPTGTRLRVTLLDGISTANSLTGDNFMASLAEPVIVEGKMVLEKGTRLRGRVVDVQESGRVKGRASIQLALTEIVRDGKRIQIDTRPFTAVAEPTRNRDAAVIAGAAGVGTAIGAVAGGKEGALVGAAIGGGAGTATVLATRGRDLHYPPETRLSFSLAKPIEI